MPRHLDFLTLTFQKAGIFGFYRNGEKERIGDPICVFALGQGLQDRLSYTALTLQDRDGKWRKAVVLSSLLTARTTEFKEQLTDVYNYRLPDRKYTSRVIDQLAARNPDRRIHITAVPGWQGKRYAHPRRNIKPKGDDWECYFANDPNVLMGNFHCKGTLDVWRREVARYCCLSSRLRLAVGSPFAATVLRKLGIDTFGFHFVGATSSGKTFCLRVAGSVPGFNSEAGVTSWDGTPTGIEQLALGRRDNALILDETAVIETDEKKAADFLRLSAYRLAKNRQKHRAGVYTRRHTVDADLRNIVLSTGEDVLHVGSRLRGQDSRLIQIPACVSDHDDILDGKDVYKLIGRTTDQREQFVHEQEAATYKYQGIALLAFLERLVNDADADGKLRTAVNDFIAESPLPQSKFARVFARIRRRIAAVYAGIALAIDYGILPFNKAASLRDLRKCLNDAIDLLLQSSRGGIVAAGESDNELISQFRGYLLAAKFIRAGAYANRTKPLTAEQLQRAEGFVNFARPERYRVMLRTRSMQAWFPDERTRNRLVSLLRNQQMVLAGRQADSSSRQVKVRPCPHKMPVYWLSLRTLGLGLEDLHIG